MNRAVLLSYFSVFIFAAVQANYQGTLLNTTEEKLFFAVYRGGLRQGNVHFLKPQDVVSFSFNHNDMLVAGSLKNNFPQKANKKFVLNTAHYILQKFDNSGTIFVRGTKSTLDVISGQKTKSAGMLRISDDTLVTQKGKVRLSYDISDQEKQFLKKRKQFIVDGFKKLGVEVEARDQMPNIGILGSGGGMRALIGYLAVLTALKDIGVWDVTTYAAGVSGSTWLLSALYGKKYTIEELKEDLQWRLKKSFLQLIYNYLFYTTEEEVSYRSQRSSLYNMVDQWGVLLGKSLFGDDGSSLRSDITLSSLQHRIKDGQMPMYLATAVTVDQRQKGGGYHWFEFTPYEVGSRDYGAFVPSQYFGAQFEGGRLVEDNFQEYPLAVCCGIFGSAFAFTLHRVLKSMKLSNLTKNTYIKDMHPVSFGQVNNYMFGLQEKGFENLLSRQKTIDLFDAAVHYNLPLRPLLHRDLDLMIFVNIFGKKNQGALLKALQDGKKQGYAMPGIPDIEYLDDEQITYVEDVKDPQAPLVLYIPNASYLFSTQKLSYKHHDFEKLYQDMYDFVMKNKDVILQACRNAYQKKNNKEYLPLLEEDVLVSSKKHFQPLSSTSMHILANQKMIVFLNTLFGLFEKDVRANHSLFYTMLDILYQNATDLMAENSVSFDLIKERLNDFMQRNRSGYGTGDRQRVIDLIRVLRDKVYFESDEPSTLILLNLILQELKAPLFVDASARKKLANLIQNKLFEYFTSLQKLSLQTFSEQEEEREKAKQNLEKILDGLDSFITRVLGSQGFQQYIDDNFVKHLVFHYSALKQEFSDSVDDALLDFYRSLQAKRGNSEIFRLIVNQLSQLIFKKILISVDSQSVSQEVIDEAYETFKHVTPATEARTQALIFLKVMRKDLGKEKRSEISGTQQVRMVEKRRRRS